MWSEASRFAAAAALLFGCGGGVSAPDAGVDAGPALDAGPVDAFVPAHERDAREAFDESLLEITGRVVDRGGVPVTGAVVALGDDTTSTDDDGRFAFAAVSRTNRLLTIDSAGYHVAHRPLVLALPLSTTAVTVEPLVLAEAGATRMVFGGDLSFARRFLDPDDDTPRDRVPVSDPAALIDAADPEPGSRAVVQWIRPLYQAADFAVVNFESPVTLAPATPHPQKDFVYFSLPGSLPALTWLGVDYVSLGNNHVYDYLEAGLADTLAHLDAAGLPHSGAGATPAQAFAPYRLALRGQDYAHVSATSVSGSQWDVEYVASADQGGAADLRDEAATSAAIAAEVDAGRVVVAHLHTGQEYTFAPSAYALSRAALAADAGAALVVGHHTHVAQGFGVEGDALVLHCLGNLAFDQDRLETMLGLVAQVDFVGDAATAAWGVPVYLEDYRPRLIGGALADVLLRRLAEASRGLGAHLVYPYGARLWLARGPQEVERLTRDVAVSVTVDERGWGVVDARGLLHEGESIAGIDAGGAAVSLRPGRDLLLHGDFEDHDVDDERFEAARWYRGGSSDYCLADAHRGAAALCMHRSADNDSDSVVAFRNRVRAFDEAIGMPRKDLSLIGQVRGDNAGAITVITRFHASVGDAEFGEAVAFTAPGGSFGWRLVASDVPLPPDVDGDLLDPEIHPRAVRLFLRHAPPASGEGLVAWDDLALVGWEEVLDAGQAQALPTPHARDFVRVEGPPGTYALTLTLARYRPAF